MSNVSIYNYERHLAGTIRRIKEDKTICAANKKVIDEFRSFLVAGGDTGTPRVMKYLCHLHMIAKLMGRLPFVNAKREDIVKVFEKIQNHGYAENTVKDYKVAMKRFYAWLRESEPLQYPKEVSWLRCSIDKDKQKKLHREDLPTPEEILKMVEACIQPRDRAFLFTLYEGGFRIGEIGSAKIGDVKIHDGECDIVVNGKTGERSVPLYACIPYLQQWLELHPLRNDKDAPLWTGFGTRNLQKQMKYAALAHIVKSAAKRAGIMKKLHPHLFRHGRMTELAAKGFQDSRAKKFAGWTMASNQMDTYIHLIDEDVKDAIAEINGTKERKPITCHACGRNDNPVGSKFCAGCAASLDPLAALNPEVERKKKLWAGGESALMKIIMEQPNLLKHPEKLRAAVIKMAGD